MGSSFKNWNNLFFNKYTTFLLSFEYPFFSWQGHFTSSLQLHVRAFKVNQKVKDHKMGQWVGINQWNTTLLGVRILQKNE